MRSLSRSSLKWGETPSFYRLPDILQIIIVNATCISRGVACVRHGESWRGAAGWFRRRRPQRSEGASVGRERAARSVVESCRWDNNEPTCPEFFRVVQSTAVRLHCCVGRYHQSLQQAVWYKVMPVVVIRFIISYDITIMLVIYM